MDVRFSFDDGLIGDIKAAKLLTKYGFTGVFYVPNNPVPNTIQASMKEIKQNIADLGHEIGGHTVSHPMDIKLCNDKQLQFEIINNKHLCEMLLAKKECPKFCYPRGRHDERVRAMVRRCGFKEARTTIVLKIRNDRNDVYQTPTTIQMFARKEYEGRAWPELAREYFHKALDAHRAGEEGVFFHLWGHTNELERQGDWENFEEMLRYIRHHLTLSTIEVEQKEQSPV